MTSSNALTPRQIADFDAYADAWAILRSCA
jgi:hypothetical protein